MGIPDEVEIGRINQYTKGQHKLFKERMGDVGEDSYLSKLAGGDEQTYREMEAPALRQFQGTIGGIASRFSAGSGRGSLGTRRSSGHQNAQTSAASNFAQELQANRANLRRQAIKDLHEMSSQLLDKRPYENVIFGGNQQEKGALGGWGGTIGTVGGGVAGAYFGGPAGAAAGASLGGQALGGM